MLTSFHAGITTFVKIFSLLCTAAFATATVIASYEIYVTDKWDAAIVPAIFGAGIWLSIVCFSRAEKVVLHFTTYTTTESENKGATSSFWEDMLPFVLLAFLIAILYCLYLLAFYIYTEVWPQLSSLEVILTAAIFFIWIKTRMLEGKLHVMNYGLATAKSDLQADYTSNYEERNRIYSRIADSETALEELTERIEVLESSFDD